MRKDRKTSLQQHIQQWLEQYDDEGHDGWIHETLVKEMAQAAALVYDASLEASRFTEREVGGH